VELIFHTFNKNIHSFHSTLIFIFVRTRAQQALQGEQESIMRDFKLPPEGDKNCVLLRVITPRNE